MDSDSPLIRLTKVTTATVVGGHGGIDSIPAAT